MLASQQRVGVSMLSDMLKLVLWLLGRSIRQVLVCTPGDEMVNDSTVFFEELRRKFEKDSCGIYPNVQLVYSGFS